MVPLTVTVTDGAGNYVSGLSSARVTGMRRHGTDRQPRSE
jgi:hypothetical protein